MQIKRKSRKVIYEDKDIKESLNKDHRIDLNANVKDWDRLIMFNNINTVLKLERSKEYSWIERIKEWSYKDSNRDALIL